MSSCLAICTVSDILEALQELIDLVKMLQAQVNHNTNKLTETNSQVNDLSVRKCDNITIREFLENLSDVSSDVTPDTTVRETLIRFNRDLLKKDMSQIRLKDLKIEVDNVSEQKNDAIMTEGSVTPLPSLKRSTSSASDKAPISDLLPKTSDLVNAVRRSISIQNNQSEPVDIPMKKST